MGGGGPKYEAAARAVPSPDSLLLPPRKERIEEVLKYRTRTLTVVLDRLEDSFNMAAVLRTCEAFGLQEVHIIKNPEAAWSPNDKVTQGCDKWLDLHRYENFAACKASLKERGFQLWVSAVTERAQSLFNIDFSGKVALVFGNERFGVSKEVLEGADGIFWIPMRGFTQSLNISASVSASVSRAIAWRGEHGQPQGDLSEGELTSLRDEFYRLSVKQRGRLYPGT